MWRLHNSLHRSHLVFSAFLNWLFPGQGLSPAPVRGREGAAPGGTWGASGPLRRAYSVSARQVGLQVAAPSPADRRQVSEDVYVWASE